MTGGVTKAQRPAGQRQEHRCGARNHLGPPVDGLNREPAACHRNQRPAEKLPHALRAPSHRRRIAGGLAPPAVAQPAADLYRGRTINLIVGSGEGGGFDLSARLAAPFLARHIPGRPAVVVQNMPGASGCARPNTSRTLRRATAASSPSRSPRSCSTRCSTLRRGSIRSPMPGLAASRRSRPSAWSGTRRRCRASREARAKELILGAVGPSGTAVMLPAALNRVAGTRITIIKGYKSAAELGLAIERGEVQGSGSVSLEYISSKGWLERTRAPPLYDRGCARSARPRRADRGRACSRRAGQGHHAARRRPIRDRPLDHRAARPAAGSWPTPWPCRTTWSPACAPLRRRRDVGVTRHSRHLSP
jgi:hypothetical protein